MQNYYTYEQRQKSIDGHETIYNWVWKKIVNMNTCHEYNVNINIRPIIVLKFIIGIGLIILEKEE